MHLQILAVSLVFDNGTGRDCFFNSFSSPMNRIIHLLKLNENNTQPVTAQELSNVAMHPRTGFPSEEAMKAYYLQLIDIMNIAYVKESSEYVSLQCLKRKLRQFIHVLQLLGTHEWGNGIAEIQDASGFYMLQSTLPHKTLLQANREIGLHLQFITQLASNVGFLKQLEGILYYHSQNVENLLKRVKEESTDTF